MIERSNLGLENLGLVKCSPQKQGKVSFGIDFGSIFESILRQQRMESSHCPDAL